MARKVIVYGTPTCRMVKPVRALLDKSDIQYKYVDIKEDSKANERVQKINNGNASVPTIVFRDGSTITEPSNKQLAAKLEGLGYTVKKITIFDRLDSFLANPFIGILGAVDIVLGFGMSAPNLTVLGVIMVTLYVIFGRILPARNAQK